MGSRRISNNSRLPAKVTEVVELAQGNGWETEAVPADLFRGVRDDWFEAAHFIARRRSQVLTMTWVDGVAMGPVGWSVDERGARPIENRAEARRILTAGGTE